MDLTTFLIDTERFTEARLFHYFSVQVELELSIVLHA